MTEGDKRQCRSDTLEELAEMRARRRCLVTKAETIQRQLRRGIAVSGAALSTEPGKKTELQEQSPEEME